MSLYLGLFIKCFWWGVDTDGGASYNPGVHMITAFSIEILLSGLRTNRKVGDREIFESE